MLEIRVGAGFEVQLHTGFYVKTPWFLFYAELRPRHWSRVWSWERGTGYVEVWAGRLEACLERAAPAKAPHMPLENF